MANIEYSTLINAAFEAQKKSYSPYSNFQVGAALLTKSGNTYLGCNIENSSYGLCNCAERTAIFNAISNGEKDFSSIVIVGKHKDSLNFDYCYPCGSCRQVLTEFCDDDFEVILAKDVNDFKIYKLVELFPNGFKLK